MTSFSSNGSIYFNGIFSNPKYAQTTIELFKGKEHIDEFETIMNKAVWSARGNMDDLAMFWQIQANWCNPHDTSASFTGIDRIFYTALCFW